MSDEIKEILANTLEYLEGIDETRNTKILTTNETNILLDYITNLQKENDRLNNIINELEKWVDEYPSEDVWYEHITNKLKKLKENK